VFGNQGNSRGNLNSVSGIIAKLAGAARIAAAGTVLSIALAFSSTASAETRTLKIYHVHTGERYEITFKRNGVYLPDGLKKLNYALRDWRRNEPIRMDPRLFDLIWEVYNRVGTNEFINVVCGYRAPETNSMLRHRSKGVAEKSQHILGRAMDFFIPGVPLKKLRYTGLQMEIGGVGYYPTSGSPFVHLDVGRVRHWPGISRNELMAVFPNGKTIHIPSDGRPLAGYEVAMAAYKARGGGSAIASAIPSSGKKRTLFQALFGGGADESEDNAGDESVAVAAAAPKPIRQKQQAAPVEPDPTPLEPQQPVIVAALPRRDKVNGVEPPRPDVDVNGQQPEVLAFAVPVPSKKPRFEAVQPNVAQDTSAADQAAIEAVIKADSAQTAATPVVAKVDPKADEEASRAALGVVTPEVAQEPFLAGNVPVPGKKPKAPETELASVAVPTPRPILESDTAVSDAAPAVEVAALEPNDGKAKGEPVLEQPAELQPAPDAVDDVTADDSTSEDLVDDTGDVVASVPIPAQKAVNTSATMRSAMLGDAEAIVDGDVKTTSKGAKPKAKDAKPGIKAVATAPTPKVGKFALGAQNIAMANQPIAPEYAQALVREAPTEVYMAGFSKDAPLQANKFSGKAVNFLRVAKFKGVK
jgi:uncharacterized protein YcbK (DUF882 family)